MWGLLGVTVKNINPVLKMTRVNPIWNTLKDLEDTGKFDTEIE